MKNLMKLGILIVALMFFSCNQEDVIDTSSSLKKANKSTEDIFRYDGTIRGTSTIHRSNNGFTVNYKTTGLKPGNAYTLWLVVWNNPENCITPGSCIDQDFPNFANVKVEVIYGSGHVVGNNGKGNFSAHLKVGDTSGSVNEDVFGLPSAGGLLPGNTFDAEIHAVLRDHGPAIPSIINEQINTYLGGCTPGSPAIPPFSGDFESVGDCVDFEAALHRVTN